jgi:hypothetical protein
MMRDADGRRYARAVETAWSRALGRAAVVSPREFEAIDAWRKRGIPLSVVLEVISAAGQQRSGRGLAALTALNHAVSEAWKVVAAGRAAPPRTDTLQPRSDALAAWQEALRRSADAGRLHALLSRLLAKAAGGGDVQSLDAELDAELPGAVSESALRAATEEASRALRQFRGRMLDEEFQRMLARALVDRLRTAFALPRMTLTR